MLFSCDTAAWAKAAMLEGRCSTKESEEAADYIKKVERLRAVLYQTSVLINHLTETERKPILKVEEIINIEDETELGWWWRGHHSANLFIHETQL